MSDKNTDFKSAMSSLEDTIALYLVKKAPAIPKEWKEIIVKFAPYIAVVVMVLALPAVLAVLGLGTLFLPFSYLGGLRAGFNYSLGLIFAVVSIVLNGLAIPGLFKRTKGGWNLLFYASLIEAVHNIISFNLGGLIIGTLLSLYILFQVKEYYK